MNSNITFLLLCLLQANLGFAQTAIPENIRTNEVVDRLSSRNGLGPSEQLYGIPLPPGRVVGSTYLDTAWKATAILLYEKDKLVEGYETRYDLRLNEFEVKANGSLKVVPGNRIKSFSWLNTSTKNPEYFVNAKNYSFNGIPMDGFVQILVDGDIQLVKKAEIVFKEADYKPQFDVGSRDSKYTKRFQYYLVKNNQATLFPKSTNKLLLYFGKHQDNVKRFIKINYLNLKNEDHYSPIVDYYNSLSQ